MERMILTPRLACIAALIPRGARLADIGTDHGKLPVSLLLSGRVAAAIGSDIRQGPLDHAARNAAEHGVALPLRLAAGLEAVRPEECDTVSIAGMGGQTIADILAAGLEKLANVSRLVLQPNNREDELRAWLVDHDFRIVDEAILEENEKFYEILVVEQGSQELTSKELRFGPFLMRVQAPAFVQKWFREVEKLAFALEQVPVENQSARASLEERIAQIKEVLHVSK